MKARRATSIVELMCVIAIVGLLLSLLAPAVQGSRDSARKLTCASNLRSIGLATAAYEASQREYPPGTSGAERAYTFDGNYLNPSSAYSWTRYQYLSALARLLAHLDPTHEVTQLPEIAFSTRRKLDAVQDPPGQPVYASFAQMEGIEAISAVPVPLFRCPADGFPVPETALVTCAIQPVVHGEDLDDRVGWRNLKDLIDGSPAFSNYIGCLGVNSGGRFDDPEKNKLCGVMSTRRGVRPRHVRRGLAHTIVFGEQLGGMESGRRTAVQSWLVGGVGRARGTQTIESWRRGVGPPVVLGDSQNASWIGFSSAHPHTVQFVFGDGHVEAIARQIGWRPFFRRCSMQRYSWRADDAASQIVSSHSRRKRDASGRPPSRWR